ncbi:MAG: hypothetical protein HUJ91_07515, partial [Bacteroidales bacterium]|nr:hypothetical protein [Bacteroidales bacterium]
AQHHPEMFCAAHPMSAWLDNKGHNSTSIRKTSPTMKKLINSVCATAPAKFVKKADAQTVEALKTLHWTIECGDDDFLFRQNIELYYAMQDRQIPAELIIRDGTHSWAFWKEGLKHTLIELEGIFAE